MHFEKKGDILMELAKTAENKTKNDAWLSLVERYVRDVEVAGSNPVASIPWQGRVEKSEKIFGFFFCSINEKQQLHLLELKIQTDATFFVFLKSNKSRWSL